MNALGDLWALDVAAFMILASIYGALAPGGIWKARILKAVIISGLAWLFPMAAFMIVFPIIQFLRR